MEFIEDDEFLCLRLAIVTDSTFDRKPKRKRRESVKALEYSNIGGCESKILQLLQRREQMLKLDHNWKESMFHEDGNDLHLIHLLVNSATSLEENKLELALKSLSELAEKLAITGDSVRRVATYFVDGLVDRLLTRDSSLYNMITKPPTHEEEFLAFTELYKVSPYYQFAHFTANQALMEAFEADEDKYNKTCRALHVVDLDISNGFQWPSLMQSVADKATDSGTRISLQITGFGRTLEELQETEARLVSFARGFKNLVFKFQGTLWRSNLVSIRRKNNETLVVNSCFHLNTLSCPLEVFDTLKYVHSLNPSIFVLVEQEGSRNSNPNFVSRFLDSLHYFAAMFDSLDDCLPLDSVERLSIEKNHLGKEIKKFMKYDRDEMDCPKYESTKTWKRRMEGSGFKEAKLSSKCIMQAKLLLKIRRHYNPIQLDGDNNGFNVFERDDANAISLCWQNRCLVTASSWNCS